MNFSCMECIREIFTRFFKLIFISNFQVEILRLNQLGAFTVRTIYLLLFLLLPAFQAQAAALYKCADPKKGAVSIQSEACPAGSKQIWVRDVTSEAPPTSEQLRAREEKRRKDSEDARALSRLAGTDNSTRTVVYQNNSNANNAKLRCDSAREYAQTIRDRDWRNLTIDRLRQLDAWVESECRPR